MKTIKIGEHTVRVVVKSEVPRCYEKWNIGKNIQDGFSAYAKFDADKRMETNYEILAVREN
jgi:hypothetical protein